MAGGWGKGKKVDWELIRERAESGGWSHAKIAQAHGITIPQIRYRALKENWATPNKVALALKEAQKEAAILSSIPGGEGKGPLPVSGHENTEIPTETQVIKGSVASYGDFVATIGEAKMRKAFLRMPDPRTWRDLKTLDDMVRRAKGLDKVTGKTAGIFSGAFGVGSFVSEISGPAFAVENDAEEA